MNGDCEVVRPGAETDVRLILTPHFYGSTTFKWCHNPAWVYHKTMKEVTLPIGEFKAKFLRLLADVETKGDRNRHHDA
jgi:hypothetical protein